MSAPRLEATGLVKRFGGVQAVREVSFSVAAGEAVALIGANGAGKTTTFNLLNGQLRPDRGSVRLDGRDITALSPAERFHVGIARTFQITANFLSMRVIDNVLLALASREGWAWALRYAFARRGAHEDRARALLARLGLERLAEAPCAALAYGDLKRLELAVALAGAPRVLLMDEPTAGMSGEERGALMQLARETARREGLALLFTEHDMDVVFGYADRILVMHRGRLIADGPPEAVAADATVREVYLGGSPIATAAEAAP
ncbi:MAG: ABC transporter ATP-binding protein [Casimicrobiaceae bacterium]|nr:ABC transporter ATP-binding protein [Casimicrobiaceae bacterium]MCX8097965.1 ABC transporter ATP-binding protein [Casimicrobiaceae bacterium]MDW8311988.1 ABC transporter ATP-binding protein [Burkholderiales bacterium]